MGQSTSRQHVSPRTSPTEEPTSTPFDVGSSSGTQSSNIPATASSRSASPTRRPSMRRSIMNLVKSHRSPSRRRVSSTSSVSRKSWLPSKRWSRAPQDADSNRETVSLPTEGSSTLSQPSIAEKGKQVIRDPDYVEPAEEATDALTPLPQASADRASEVFAQSSAIETANEAPPDLSAECPSTIPVTDENAGNGDVTFPPASDPAPVEEPSSPIGDPPSPSMQPSGSGDNEAPAQQQTPTRQFPPPGTLVVVQGVVHTADVPRSQTSSAHSETSEPFQRPSSTPPTTTSPGARNRLSALLRPRPASMASSRSSSAIDHAIPGTESSATLDALAQPENVSESPETPDPRLEPQMTNELSAGAEMPSSNEPSTGISSSSIEVLGALLSVAAAATAASLLTGSSDPLLSSPLSPPPSYNPNGQSTADRPTSPTPTAGLANGDSTTTGRAERLRTAWSGIRERLGLRPSPPATSSGNASDSDPTSFSATNSDPRELMLAQMARAFNLGLGINADSPAHGNATSSSSEGPRESSTNPNSADSSSDQEASRHSASTDLQSSLPPEGSFERFLIDLQGDLRLALTSHGNSNQETPASSSSDNEDQEQALLNSYEPASSDNTATTSGRTFAAPVDVDDDNDSMPDLDSVSDSDSDSSSDFGDAQETFTDEGANTNEVSNQSPISPSEAQSARGEVPQPTTQTQAAEELLQPRSSTSAPEDRSSANDSESTQRTDTTMPGERINWWRLYRFPPITTHRQTAAGIPASSPSPSAASPHTELSSRTSTTEVDPTLAELPFANTDIDHDASQRQAEPDQNANTVVPVIVVGLQSVHQNWPHPGGSDEHQHVMDMFGAEAREAGVGGDDEGAADGAASEAGRAQGTSGGNASPRGRGWPARAAEAIRNWRPGRRNRETPSSIFSGSRTFLIYVIGGYYPPNHSIVTGGPNNLNSFEALLEIAELLGQVKPPTASKEDIEKSGLEIIKPDQLRQYEADGKVAPNCIERCLICLDDYTPEDDIRVMNCRHAFHKTCVDKWLETGRNNCPACRSKGVPVDSAPPMAQHV